MRCILSLLLSFTLLFSSIVPSSLVKMETETNIETEENTTTNPPAAAADEVSVSAPSVVLMESSTGQVIYEKEPDMLRHPASITKIMTMILIFDALAEGKISLDDTVTVSEYAASMGGSQVFLEAGETQTVDTMLKCISVASANDACVAYRNGKNIHSLRSEFIVNRQFSIGSHFNPVDQFHDNAPVQLFHMNIIYKLCHPLCIICPVTGNLICSFL